MQIKVTGIEFDTADEAIRHAKATGRVAVRLGGEVMVVQRAEAHRLDEAGVPFAYLNAAPMGDGSERIVTVPVH